MRKFEVFIQIGNRHLLLGETVAFTADEAIADFAKRRCGYDNARMFAQVA
jgi:hypothetical protein